tara:strand:+ start:6480 stop:7745 length:1266 start_codon:yes stop_codon:yes gene_type:complete
MSLLDDNIYAQNVALKNQSIGGFQNPLSNMTTPNFNLPMNMTPPAQQPAPQPKQNMFSRLVFGGNTPPEAREIQPNQLSPNQQTEKAKIKQFLESLPEHQQILAMLDPEGFIDTTLKNMEKTADQKDFAMAKDNPEYKDFFYKVHDLDPTLIYEKELAKKSATQGMPEGFVLSQSQIKEDEVFASEFAKFMGGGKVQKELANLSAYDFVLTNLENAINGGTNMTGAVIGMMPDALRAVSNPDAQNVYDTLRGVVMQSLKETLGGQFTEREGQKLIEAAYNPLLSEEINYKRVKRLRDATVGRVINRMKKKEYYDSEIGVIGDKDYKPKNTLQGYDYTKDIMAMDYQISDIENPDGSLKLSEADLTKISDAMILDLFDVTDYEGMTEQEMLEYYQGAKDIEKQFITQNSGAINKIIQKGGNN